MTQRPRWLLEVLALAAVTLVVALGYRLTHPPLYNPAASIDPWLYTALFVDFDRIYGAFVTTYYASRLPLIIPGYVLNLLFDPKTAYFLLHGIFFLAGGLFVYLLVRSWFGRIPALATYAWITGSQMYFDAHRWDYWDGTIITYLAAALYFALSPPPRAQLRILWLGLAGFFLAAAVTTNLYVFALAFPLPLIYTAVTWPGSISAFARRAAVDVSAFLGGFIVLLIGGGLFAAANGAKFWFVGPQIQAARDIDESVYKQQYSAWLPQEPRMIVPVFLVVLLGVLVWRGGSEWSAPRRAALGGFLYLGSLCFLLGLYEFAFGGYFLEYLYYFNPLLPGMSFCFGALCFYLVRNMPRAVAVGAVIAVIAAVEASLFYVYWGDSIDRVGTVAYWIGAALMGVAAASLIARLLLYRRPLLRSATALVAVLAFAGGSAYAFNGSLGTFVGGDTHSRRISTDTFQVAMLIVPYLRSELGDGPLPAFWYDRMAEGGAHVGIQSLYYFEYTYVGLDMPKVNDDFKTRLAAINPEALVLLCSDQSCDGGPDNLRSKGVPIDFRAERRFANGDLLVWVKIFDLTRV